MTALSLFPTRIRPIMNPPLSPVATEAKREEKLLIVTHDAEFGLLLRLAFKTEPYIIYETTNEEIASKLCSDIEFELVLLDIVTPPIEKANILQQIRQINQTIPIIIISALNAEKWIEVALANGADGFVVKPFSLTTIRHKVAKVLEKDKLKVKPEAVS